MVSNSHLFIPTLLLYHLLIHAPTLAAIVPVKYKIKPKQTECIYEQFADGDIVTFSVFVVEALYNGKPKASTSFEGPVAGNKNVLPRGPESYGKNIDDELELERASRRGKMTTGRIIRSSLLSDWTKIKGPHAANGVIERNLKIDWTHAGESEDAAAARAVLRQKNHNEFREHKLENMDKVGNAVAPLPLHTIAQSTIHPYEETHAIKLHGWYRLCVESNLMPLVVEMDMRSADKLKGINPGTGHVYTHVVRGHLDEKQSLLGGIKEGKSTYNTSDGHKQVKRADLKESKIKLGYIHELTSEILKSQNDRIHRIHVHDADARRGAAEVVWSSKFETLLYVMITVFQVYTVHKWLLGNLLLGK